jgi:hypothetical protein
VKLKRSEPGIPLFQDRRRNGYTNRPFTFQDFDLRHAAAAIPDCDVFLTERFIATACTNKLLDFGTLYATRIISDEGEAIETVSELGAR